MVTSGVTADPHLHQTLAEHISNKHSDEALPLTNSIGCQLPNPQLLPQRHRQEVQEQQEKEESTDAPSAPPIDYPSPPAPCELGIRWKKHRMK